MKMIDIWLICCLVIPFLEVILRTTIECFNCSCDICEGKDANAEGDDKKKGQTNAVHVTVGTGAKVAPEQVTISGYYLQQLKYAFPRARAEKAPQLRWTRSRKRAWRPQGKDAQKGPGGVSS